MGLEKLWKKTNEPAKDGALTNPSRRLFLQASAGLAASYALGASAQEILPTNTPKTPATPIEAAQLEQGKDFELGTQVDQLINQLELFYSLDIKHRMSDLADSPLAVNVHNFSELSPNKKLEAVLLLVQGFSRYPHFLISGSDLERVLISTPTVGRQEDIALGYINHYSNVDASDDKYRPELAIAYDWNNPEDVPKKFLVKTEKDASGNDIPPDMKLKFTETLHHELAHFFIDAVGSDNASKIIEAKLQSDWEEKFEAHSKNARKSFARRYTPDAPVLKGFSRNYGSEDSVEDRGTVAEMIFTTDPSSYQNTKDKILKAKIEKIKTYYFNISCGLINESYWPFVKTLSPEDMNKFFITQAREIVNTSHENYQYRDKVSADTYATWKNKLKLEYRTLVSANPNEPSPNNPLS